jgi:hypothetical protein
MSITNKEDFFKNFDELIRVNSLMPNLFKLGVYNINGQNMGLEDIVRIMAGIREGNREQLNRWRDVQKYLNITLEKIRMNEEFNKKGMLIQYSRDEDENVHYSRLEKYMGYVIHKLLNVLEKKPDEFARFFGLMKPSEQMALASLERQGTLITAATTTTPERRKRLLPEIFREEIGPYVGKKPKGGTKHNKSKRRRLNKSKNRHNKRTYRQRK